MVTSWSNSKTSNFQAIFVAPIATRNAQWYLRSFVGLDSAYTKSKYQMQFFVACTIDANNRGVLLAWALVPIENKL